jgi:NAD(P)-dependent dehydrogenase (short-subunit alcohol dehydrogenase family)
MTSGPMSAKTVFVTGAARGLGRAAALVLAARGASLMLTDGCLGAEVAAYPLAEESDLAETAARCRAAGAGSVETVVVDVRKTSEIEAAVGACAAALGGIDVLVNSAGVIGPVRPAHLLTDIEWEFVLDTNLTGAWRCIRAVVPGMIERGRGGSIINIASTAGLVAFPHFANYVAAKHGLVGLTKAAALDFAEHKIRVNAICPTSLRSNGLGPSMLGGVASMLRLRLDEYEAFSLPNHPLGMLPADEDAAFAVAWLASDEAATVTGAALAIDAGFTAR